MSSRADNSQDPGEDFAPVDCTFERTRVLFADCSGGSFAACVGTQLRNMTSFLKKKHERKNVVVVMVTIFLFFA